MADGMMHSTQEHSEKREETAVRDDAAREPVRQPEALATQAPPLDELQLANDANPGLFERIHQKVASWRNKAITVTPNLIVNNSSNILGATHVATEVMMLKASAAKDLTGKTEFIRKNPQLHHYVTDPIKNVWKGSIQGSKPGHKFSEVFKDGIFKGFKNYLTNGAAAADYEYGVRRANIVEEITGMSPEARKTFTDKLHEDYLKHRDGAVAKATDALAKKPQSKNLKKILELAEAEAKQPLPTGDALHSAAIDHRVRSKSLPNRWQMRSTLFGLAVWTLSTFIPDKKEDSNEVEHMAELMQTNPLKYVGERLRQAVWVPEWREHKRQMIGLGVTLSGICSMLGAWRLRGSIPVDGRAIYSLDKSYLAQSVFTFGSGSALLLSLDDERGFSRFGMGMIGRLLFLPTTLGKKYGIIGDAGPEHGRHWYAGATLSFQAENMAQGLIGGAEKNPDGSIIDHAAIRNEAKLKATIKVAAKKAGEPITDEEIEARIKKIQNAEAGKASMATSQEKPTTLISQFHDASMAMPERVAAYAEQQKNMS